MMGGSFIGLERLAPTQQLPTPMQAMTPATPPDSITNRPGVPLMLGSYRGKPITADNWPEPNEWLRYVPSLPPRAPESMDTGVMIGNGSLFGLDGFWPRLIAGFAVGGALAWLIPTLMAR